MYTHPDAYMYKPIYKHTYRYIPHPYHPHRAEWLTCVSSKRSECTMITRPPCAVSHLRFDAPASFFVLRDSCVLFFSEWHNATNSAAQSSTPKRDPACCPPQTRDRRDLHPPSDCAASVTKPLAGRVDSPYPMPATLLRFCRRTATF